MRDFDFANELLHVRPNLRVVGRYGRGCLGEQLQSRLERIVQCTASAFDYALADVPAGGHPNVGTSVPSANMDPTSSVVNQYGYFYYAADHGICGLWHIECLSNSLAN